MPRKPFLIRLDPAVLTAIEAWAADDLRSVNAQIEFLLREALRKAGRKVKPAEPPAAEPAEPAEATEPAPRARLVKAER
ncbi:MAG: hypothetical protein F9K40_18925 [Kofleriaceae bacterium]|nr:MAG: hypothetical protein F9K40_18925 [Kofleriaceae bacterium]MBZ0234335.1 hypothetical protein [Kofleriaceae bacterium]